MGNETKLRVFGAIGILVFGLLAFGGLYSTLLHDRTATPVVQAAGETVRPTPEPAQQPISIRQMGTVQVEIYYSKYSIFVYICRENGVIVPCSAVQ